MNQRRRLERLEGGRREALIAQLSDEEIWDGLALCKRAAGDGIETLSAAEVAALLRVVALIDPEAPVWIQEELAAARAAAGEGASPPVTPVNRLYLQANGMIEASAAGTEPR